GFHGRSAESGIEEARGSQSVVPYHPGGEAEARGTGEEAVRGILLEQLGSDVTALAIGFARGDETQEVAYVPSALDEFDGEPVEKLGVGGEFPLQAEVLGRPHQALTEQ